MHVSLLSCLSASPVDLGFLYDKKYHTKGNSKRDTAGDNELGGTQSDDSYWFIGRDKERNNYNIIWAVF